MHSKSDLSLRQQPHPEESVLQALDPSKQLKVEFVDVNAWVPVLFQTTGSSKKKATKHDTAANSNTTDVERGDQTKVEQEEGKPKERQVLFNITGCVEPGEILALMGPSGSGKSTLLALLGGRSNFHISGSVIFGAQALNKAIKRHLGYVMQDDLLFAELTVYETLYYAAKLRLPRTWSHEQKVARVELVIQTLGLQKCRNTIIGNHMRQGVSGGERKRVSIGHELLINPSVVFLDEPTSGLDSTTALKLMHTLRALASGGRTIISSIHQPSSRLYHMINKLMLLSDGHTMYYGSAHFADQWFGQLGQDLPYRVNIADHVLDLACGDLPGRSLQESQDISNQLVQAYKNRSIGLGEHGIQPTDFKDVLKLGKLAACSSNISVSSSVQETDARVRIGAVSSFNMGSVGNVGTAELSFPEENAKWGATFFEQVVLLTQRSVQIRRFSTLSVQKLCQLLVVAVMAGLFWFQLGAKVDTRQHVLDIGGLLFFEVLFMSFSTMFSALFVFPSEFRMLVKERQSGMYRLSAYYLARSAADFPMDLLVPTFFCWIVYWFVGLRITAGAFFSNWWAIMLSSLVAQAIGLLLGATITNPQNSQTISTILNLTLMLVSGFYVRSVPVWISWLRYISPIYWGYNLLLKIEFGHRGYPCAQLLQDNPGATVGNYCTIGDADILPINPDTSPGLDVGMLLAIFVVLRIAVYFALQYKTTFKASKPSKAST